MSEPYELGNFSSSSNSPHYSDSSNPSKSPPHTNNSSAKRRDYHDSLDDTCVVPLHSHSDICNDDDEESPKSPLARAVIAGLIAFVYIAAFVWFSDKYGPLWAAIFGSIPGTLLAAIFFTEENRKASLVFGLILGGVAAIAAAAIFYGLTVSTRLDKYTVFVVSLIIWVVVIGVLFTLFRDKFENNSH